MYLNPENPEILKPGIMNDVGRFDGSKNDLINMYRLKFSGST